VEVGAVWSAPAPAPPEHHEPVQAEALHSGHLFVDPDGPTEALAMKQAANPASLAAVPLHWRQGLH